MSTVRLVSVSSRFATVALLALFPSAPASAASCIDMNLRFEERKPSAALVESMKKEAASIWESYGVWLQWRATPSPARCASTQASFEVVLNRNPRRSRSSHRILGSTHLAVRTIGPVTVCIDLEATEELLGSVTFERLARLLGPAGVGPGDVGRALGRVLAHEVGHVLLAAGEHQRRGLMRPTFVAEDLLNRQRGSYTLSPAEVTRLRLRERALTLSASEPPGDGPVSSMARAPADALTSSYACSVAPLSGIDGGR
jgi:hypothetical protein